MNIVYFDLETQNLFSEVKGRDLGKLLLACGVTWATDRKDFSVYWETEASALIAELRSADLVVGFNVMNFDYEVLKPYAPGESFRGIRTRDMLQDIFRTLNFRISLDSIAKATLGKEKTADGLQSVQWFREGKLEKVAEYCKADVEITRKVFEFGRDNGYVNYYSKLGSKLKVTVNWK